jgi:hypothetical protein
MALITTVDEGHAGVQLLGKTITIPLHVGIVNVHIRRGLLDVVFSFLDMNAWALNVAATNLVATAVSATPNGLLLSGWRYGSILARDSDGPPPCPVRESEIIRDFCTDCHNIRTIRRGYNAAPVRARIRIPTLAIVGRCSIS